MIINFGVNRKEGNKTVHKNDKIDIPEVTEKNYMTEFKLIREKIQEMYPMWAITGWAERKK